MVRKEESSSSVDAWEETAVLIAQELRDWSEKILEVPADTFGGLPPCPFARKAWMDENVMVHVTQDISSVVEIKACFPPTEDLMHIIALTDYDDMTADEFDQWIEDQNKAHFGVWIMGFHPDADVDPLTPEYEGLGVDDYAIIVMQSLDHLVSASEILRRTPYYANFPADDMAYINKRKETFNAWDEKVNAKAYREQEEVFLAQRINDEEVDH